MTGSETLQKIKDARDKEAKLKCHSQDTPQDNRWNQQIIQWPPKASEFKRQIGTYKYYGRMILNNNK